MNRYIVVANQTLDSDELLGIIQDRLAGGPGEFWLVVPATPVKDAAGNEVPIPMPVMGGAPPLPHAPEEAQQLARTRLAAALAKLTAAGVVADGVVTDADPVPAVEQAVAARQFDEIIVVTLPARLSRWLHQDLPNRLAKRTQLPVTDVAMADL